jgi:hypothetical protein
MIATAISESREDLPDLQPARANLEAKLDLIQDLAVQAMALQAKKQEMIQQINGLQDDAAKLIAFLHSGVKQHYGTRSEMLARFGLQPFRGVRRRARPEASSSTYAEPATAGTPQE